LDSSRREALFAADSEAKRQAEREGRPFLPVAARRPACNMQQQPAWAAGRRYFREDDHNIRTPSFVYNCR
jgi:hypothetical protein